MQKSGPRNSKEEAGFTTLDKNRKTPVNGSNTETSKHPEVKTQECPDGDTGTRDRRRNHVVWQKKERAKAYTVEAQRQNKSLISDPTSPDYDPIARTWLHLDPPTKCHLCGNDLLEMYWQYYHCPYCHSQHQTEERYWASRQIDDDEIPIGVEYAGNKARIHTEPKPRCLLVIK